MHLQKYPKCGFIATWLIAISAQPSIGFSIVPEQPDAIRNYDESVSYLLPDGTFGETWLDTFLPFYPDTIGDIPGGVTEIERGGTQGLLNLLQPFVNQGWSFIPASRDLEGIFGIFDYYACGLSTP
ncbi:MAG: hypothetical protein J7540_00255 [Roseofilum sp. SID2]|uniref:hypothetical protein n=1 Tax=Roseofilum sp. SID2 TaxID=2821498 RepID=UPI001B149014|nr:hypothetical protein [Roseofilum sp. SID2]MBP0022424.1 hypothetical protein [Roseofilum sp. SID2]